jgi:hypothetical protein
VGCGIGDYDHVAEENWPADSSSSIGRGTLAVEFSNRSSKVPSVPSRKGTRVTVEKWHSWNVSSRCGRPSHAVPI